MNGTHGVVSSHPISTSLPQVDGWSTGPPNFGVSHLEICEKYVKTDDLDEYAT